MAWTEQEQQNVLSTISRLDYRIQKLEANQTKSESGTTACLAAGCGRDEETAARLAGWQARWCLLKIEIEERLDSANSEYRRSGSGVKSIRPRLLTEILERMNAIEEADA